MCVCVCLCVSVCICVYLCVCARICAGLCVCVICAYVTQHTPPALPCSCLIVCACLDRVRLTVLQASVERLQLALKDAAGGEADQLRTENQKLKEQLIEV